MEIDEELLREMRKNERSRQKEELYYAEEPDWMIYQERKREVPLNEFGGIFQKKDETSINTAPSVFEKGTIFKTGKTG
ncbi:MAG: hypothetical protein IJM25_08755 [Eubacterium sp.]|nr:hypothetical protein [Eubacterium sp.]